MRSGISAATKTKAVLVALATLVAVVVPLVGVAIAHADNEHDLQVFPEVDRNPTGTTHTLTARLVGNVGPGGEEIDFEIESGPSVVVNVTGDAGAGGTANADGNSPQTPDLTCTVTVNNGTCTVTFTSMTQGTNVIRAWVDDDKDNATQDFDASEGRYAGGGTGADGDCQTIGGLDPDPSNLGTCVASTASAGSRTDPDDTDVVEKIWGQGLAAACLDAEPETDINPSGTEHTITARATSSGAAIVDAAGTFECTGTALANTTVDISITDDDPEIFIKSVNGVATGGPVAAGPDTFSATTDANGQIAVVIQCVSNVNPATNCDGINSIRLEVQGAASGSSFDIVTKEFSPGGTLDTFTATPTTATNEVGQVHTITCRARDAFGAGLAGLNCDAQVTAGPNEDNNIGTDANTTNGYVGQCVTAADGTCTISYTSSEVGTDTIRVFQDIDNDDVRDTAGGGEPFVDISKTWVAVGQGVADVDVDMRNADSGETDCNDIQNGTDDANDDSTATNPVLTDHVICAELFNSSGTRLAGEVTFTILSGPGAFVDRGGPGTADDVTLGASMTAQEDPGGAGAGFNFATVTSTQTGTTTIEARSGNVTATVTKVWSGASGRNITLSATDTTPTTGQGTTVSARVTDRFGNPVQGVIVSWAETGVATFTAQETVTDVNGEAQAILFSTSTGTSTVTATIVDEDPNTGGNQTAECSSPANVPAGTTTAGNCSDSETLTWGSGPAQPQCSDGIDNDGDGGIDAGDPDCDSNNDNSEAHDPVTIRRNSTVTHRYAAGATPPAHKGRVFSGPGCKARRRVVVRKVRPGADLIVGQDRTNRRGRYSIEDRRANGRFYATVLRKQFRQADGDLVICRADSSRIHLI